MPVSVTTDSAIEPVSVAELRDWLRIDQHDDNPMLARLITAARQRVEEVCFRALITKTFTLTLDRLATAILLPYPPAQSITHVKYYDGDNAQQTMATALYTLDVASEPARLVQAYNQSYPSALSRVNAVEVKYLAGFGADMEDVPAGLRQAVLFLASHWYEHRETIAFASVSTIPMAVDSLLWQYRVLEVR